MNPHQQRAEVLLQQGRYDRAAPELRQALAADPDNGFLDITNGYARIDFRLQTRYVDKKAKTLDEALAMIDQAKHEGKAAQVKAQHAQRIDHEVHGHGVAGVLGAAQTGFDQCESCLPECYIAIPINGQRTWSRWPK